MAANEEVKIDTSGARRELNQLIAKLKQVGKEAGATEDELKGMVDTTKGAGKKAGKGLGDVGGGLGNISKLAKGAGVAMVAAFAVEQIVKFGTFVLDTEKKFTKLRMEIKRFSGLTGKALKDATVNVEGLAQTFEKETGEITQSANALAKQFGIGFEDALGLIEEGFLQGADASGDFLHKLNEYPVQFKNAGFSAQEFINVASQEAKGGIYDDKLLDSVKELGLSLRELTKSQTDALKGAFGNDFTAKFTKDIESGAIDTKQALVVIQKEMKKTGLNTRQMQTLTADLFKGAGEDAGGATVVIDQLNKALATQTGEYDELAKKQKETLDVQKDLAEQSDRMAKMYQGLGSTLSNFTTQVLTEVLRAFNDMDEAIRSFFDQEYRINLKVEAGFEGVDLDNWDALNKKIIEQKALLKDIQKEEDKIVVQKRIAQLTEARKAVEAKNRAANAKKEADALAKKRKEEAAALKITTAELQKRLEARRKLNAEIDTSAEKLKAEAELVKAGGDDTLAGIDLLEQRALAAFDKEIEAINNRKNGVKLSEEEVAALRLDVLTNFEQKRDQEERQRARSRRPRNPATEQARQGERGRVCELSGTDQVSGRRYHNARPIRRDANRLDY
jgi:hypothetical protein